MSQLAQLQADFQAYLFDDVKGAGFKKCIVNDKKVGVKKRLNIYYDAYRLRIIEAIASSYPNLKALLGDDLFDKTARTYIDQYPSTFRNMRWVGDKLNAHLTKTLPQHPIAAEMATFEWVLGLAFDAEDASILTLQDLGNIPPENWANLHFQLHPSVHLLTLEWNVLSVWQALNAQESLPELVKINAPCLVWRQNLNSYFRSLSGEELNALRQVQCGETFGSLCTQLEITHQDQASLQVAQFLAGWIEAGILKPLSYSNAL